MNYQIFRILSNKEPQLIGRTRYENDALHLLKNWHMGFILDKKGNVIHTKNCTPPKMKEN